MEGYDRYRTVRVTFSQPNLVLALFSVRGLCLFPVLSADMSSSLTTASMLSDMSQRIGIFRIFFIYARELLTFDELLGIALPI